ncbi:MAG: SDR family oxidoreductase [Proteobacteria bacterium]|nr:SDR family oxidoreductase [Pseudomonadota bacterium]
MALSQVKGKWALVLGASSGFGESISLRLADEGMNICGVHLDRKGTLPHVEEIIAQIKKKGVETAFFNANAADKDKRTEVIGELTRLAPEGIHCLVHSLAFGSLKPFISKEDKDHVSKDALEMTLDVMANSLVYWAQDLFKKNLLAKGGRIFAMTSSGGTRVWPTYGPVSAAKSALESHCRQLALELAPFGITANAVRAGVTDTPALRKIPGNDVMIEMALQKNPHKRLTTPKEVADCIALLVRAEAGWISGNVLGVDGGEDIVG